MDDYTDILTHPRHSLQHHIPMKEESRAAQFSAFAALTGYDEEISETARLTDSRDALAEDDLAELDAAFRHLLEAAPEHPRVTLVYFLPDARKNGGCYTAYTGCFRHFDAAARILKFTDGKEIPMQAVSRILL